MQRRNFIQSVAFSPAALEAADPTRTRPNFLFMIADDLTFRAIHGLNNEEVRTPTLDHLMKSGCTFTHCLTACRGAP
jgi:arylsulfatase A-like enzyme